MPDTDRLINKAQGDDIITALNGITSRLQEMYTVDSALSSTSEHPVQNKVVKEALDNKADESDLADKADKSDIASTKTASGNPITITDAAQINAESLVVELEPKQEGSGDPSPTNVRPITGYTECDVDDVGKNLLDTTTTATSGGISFTSDADGYVTASPNDNDSRGWGYANCQYTGIELESGTYYIDWWASTLSSSQYKAICVFDTSDNMLVFAENFSENGSQSFTLTQKTTIGVEAKIYDSAIRLQIRKSTLPSTYEPYHSSNATIQFGQTIYGGEVDFLTGVLTVDSGIIASYNGETLPSTWISDRDVYVAGTTPTTGAQVCYKLATPQTIQLTPTELKLLLKYNNITTNGTTITIGYQPDNVIGEIEAEIEKHLEMPWVKVIDNDTTIDFDDIPIEYAQEYAYVLADNEFFKHRFILLEIYEMVGGLIRSYVSGSALLSIDTLLEFSGNAYGEMISFSRNYTIVEVLVGIVEDDGVYKLTISLENDGQTQFNDFRARARYVD